MADKQLEQVEQLIEQVIDLQSQLAFQEDTLQALDRVVSRQQQQIADLQEMWQKQRKQLESLHSDPAGMVQETPPHY